MSHTRLVDPLPGPVLSKPADQELRCSEKTSRPCLCFECFGRLQGLVSYFSPYEVLVSVLTLLAKFTCIVLRFLRSFSNVEWFHHR